MFQGRSARAEDRCRGRALVSALDKQLIDIHQDSKEASGRVCVEQVNAAKNCVALLENI